MHGTLQTRERSQRDLELLFDLACAEARSDFWAYRQFINPTMLRDWFPRQLARELQLFYNDMKAGRRPILLLTSPPQHGKSRSVSDFISWVAGDNPDLPVIYSSYSDRLGVRANLYLQRIYDSTKYQRIFSGTRINSRNTVNIRGYLRNHEILEYLGREGSFRNTTVNGPVTGEALGMGVIDDPIKGRAEARSPTVRQKTWDWLTDDFLTRFSNTAGLLMIMTRWHMDDPGGRLIEAFPHARVVNFKAIAVKDEQYRKEGEALFPALKPLDFLLMRKNGMTIAGWESVYQGNPIVVGGDEFPVELMPIMPHPPLKTEILASVRYWDKAGTKDGGKFTSGTLMHLLHDGRFVVEDVIRGQWSYHEREKKIKETAIIDATASDALEIWVEQEPGSGGKESAERTVAMLAGHNVYKDRVTGSKETRAEPYAAQVQAGNIWLVAGRWNKSFKEEHEVWPNGPYKDQVDSAAGAFAKCAEKIQSGYDESGSWM